VLCVLQENRPASKACQKDPGEHAAVKNQPVTGARVARSYDVQLHIENPDSDLVMDPGRAKRGIPE